MTTPMTQQDLNVLAEEIDRAEGWYPEWQFEDVPDEDGEEARERMMHDWAAVQTDIDAMYGV